MKKLFLAILAIYALAASPAEAQCTGIFQPGFVCGNNSGSAKPAFPYAASNVTGPGTTVVGDLAIWNNTNGTSLADLAPGALTKVDDTNITVTLGGTPATALVRATSLTLGWTGTLAAARLNANVVQAIINDTNITGSIAAQSLTLGWTGTLAAGRLNANVVQAITNDTNVTGSITAQNLTLGWSGVLSVARGGTGSGSRPLAFDNIAPVPTRAGDILYWNGTNYVSLAGNNSGTKFLQEDASGFPSWVTVAGTGTVTSAQVIGAGIAVNSGTCTITSTGACTITVTASTKAQMIAATDNTTAVTPVRINDSDGVAKATVYCSSVGVVNFGYNVTSCTRGTTGQYTMTFTVAFGTANYACIVSGDSGAVASVLTGSQVAGSAPIRTTLQTSGAALDAAWSAVCYGRQ